MKVIPLTEAKANLSAVVDHAQENGPVVLTRNGKSVAVLITPEDDDALERLLLAHSKKLKTLLEARDQQIKAGRTLSHEEVWKHL
jgi:prevent-host-death family protein